MRRWGRDGIVMSRKLIEQLRYTKTFNQGFWLSAKIYSDQRGNCPCGGKFSARQVFKNIEYPVCGKCGEYPKLFRIRAKVVDTAMQEKYVDIRHHNAERLKDIVDVFTCLKQVKAELDNGTFDLRKYDSQESREYFLFENYSAAYIEYHENRLKRGEISPAGLSSKQKYVRVLLKHFTGKDIFTIHIGEVERFKNSFTDRFRTRDLALGELKSILHHAHKFDKLPTVPKFDLIPASKKRKEVVSLEDALKIINAVEDERYKIMLKLLTVYPVRPCELRALQWRDIDYFGNTVKFERHFSEDVLLDGRKSLAAGELDLEFPLTEWFREFLLCLPRPLKKDQFILPGKVQEFVSENCLQRAWRKARNKLRMPPYQLYEMRHARLSQIAEQSNGNIQKVMKASGHTNPKTLMERYVRDTSDLREFFQ
jgi:integrase